MSESDQAQFGESVVAAGASAGSSMDGDPEALKNMQMPSAEEIWKMIEGMDDISDEERENIRQNLFFPEQNSAEDFLKQLAGTSGPARGSWDYVIFFAMITIILLVFVLFGYKLYKSVMAKELKKQQKLKSKQSKKGKKQQ